MVLTDNNSLLKKILSASCVIILIIPFLVINKIWILLAICLAVLGFTILWRYPLINLGLIIVVYYLRGDQGLLSWATLKLGYVNIYPLDLVVVSVLLVFFLKVLLGKIKIPSSKLNLPVSLLIGYLVFTGLVGFLRGNPWDSIARDTSPLFYWCIFYVSATYFNKFKYETFLKSFYYFGLLIMLFAIISKALDWQLYSWAGMSYVPLLNGMNYSRVWGLPYGDTYYAYMLLFSISKLLAPRRQNSNNEIKSGILIFGLFLSSLLLVLILIRGIFFATIIGSIFLFFVFFIKVNKKNLFIFLLASGTLLTVILLVANLSGIAWFNVYIERYLSIFKPNASAISAQRNFEVRLQDFEVAQKLITGSEIIGAGGGLVPDALKYGYSEFTKHNGFAEILVIGGYLGLVIWVFVLVTILWIMGNFTFATQNARLLSELIPIQSSFIAYSIYNFSSGVLPISEFSAVAAVLLGISSVIIRKVDIQR